MCICIYIYIYISTWMNVKCVSMKGNQNSTQQNEWHDVSQTGRNLDTGGTTCFSIQKPVAGASILLATDCVLHDSWCFFRHYAAELAPIEKHGFGPRGIYTLFWIHWKNDGSHMLEEYHQQWACEKHQVVLTLFHAQDQWLLLIWILVLLQEGFPRTLTLALSPKVLGPCFLIGCMTIRNVTFCIAKRGVLHHHKQHADFCFPRPGAQHLLVDFIFTEWTLRTIRTKL